VGEDKFQDLFFCSGAIAESHFSSGQANDYWAQHLNAGKSGANATTVPQNTSQIKNEILLCCRKPREWLWWIDLEFCGNLRLRNRLPSEVLSTH
jgi:hypothetical protein